MEQSLVGHQTGVIKAVQNIETKGVHISDVFLFFWRIPGVDWINNIGG